MPKAFQIINSIKSIAPNQNKEAVKALWYFLIMLAYSPFWEKKNCTFCWKSGRLQSKFFDKAYSYSNSHQSEIELDPVLKIKLLHYLRLISEKDIDVELPMMVHFAYFYHYRHLDSPPSDDDNIDYLKKQVPGYNRPDIKAAYEILKQIGLFEKWQKATYDSFLETDWKKVIK